MFHDGREMVGESNSLSGMKTSSEATVIQWDDDKRRGKETRVLLRDKGVYENRIPNKGGNRDTWGKQQPWREAL